mgnify:CR=1 FL=1
MDTKLQEKLQLAEKTLSEWSKVSFKDRQELLKNLSKHFRKCGNLQQNRYKRNLQTDSTSTKRG